jgi:hypothetical protein
MAEQRKPRKKTGKRPYVHRSNSICVTLYSQDGQPVARNVLDEAEEFLTNIANQHRLLVAVSDA